MKADYFFLISYCLHSGLILIWILKVDFVKLKEIVNFRGNKIKGIKKWELFLTLKYTLVVMIVFLVVNGITNSLEVSNIGEIINNNRGKYFLLLFYSIIISPLVEEIYFRDLLVNALEYNTHLGKKMAIIISSIFFALGHTVNINKQIDSFVFGLLSGILYEKTRNLTNSILMHIIVNIVIISLELLIRW